jgi:hypothetical protein
MICEVAEVNILTDKRKYMMMPMLISGPQQPGINIDVYLRPLIDDMKKLWSSSIQVYDAIEKKPFTLHGMILCTVTDIPGGRSVCGQCKGGKDCMHCLDDTKTIWLNHSKKRVYIRHQRFLPKSHPYRHMKRQFYGTREIGDPPRHFDGKHVYKQVKDFPAAHGKNVGNKKREQQAKKISRTSRR